MIVDTAIVFDEAASCTVPGFLFDSDDFASDSLLLGRFRVELFFDLDRDGRVFLEARLPDRDLLLARSKAIDPPLLARFADCLSEAPSAYHLGLRPAGDSSKAVALRVFGDDLLDPSGEAGRARRLMEASKWRDAAAVLRRVLDDRPWLRGGRTALGRCLSALGDDAGAERAYRDELESCPSSYLALNNLGIVYKRRAWFEHAFDCHSRALSLYPNHYEGLVNFSSILFYFGDHGGVRYALARALAVNPEGALVGESLKALGRAVGVERAELEGAVRELAASVDLGGAFCVEEGKADLVKQEAYRHFVEEAFRDGRLEAAERQVLAVAARLLDIPVSLQCRLVVESQLKYWKGGLGPERPLDRTALIKRLEGLAARDGRIKPREEKILRAVAESLNLVYGGGDG